PAPVVGRRVVRVLDEAGQADASQAPWVARLAPPALILAQRRIVHQPRALAQRRAKRQALERRARRRTPRPRTGVVEQIVEAPRQRVDLQPPRE
ncbi:MAG: hypothetical protein ACK559_13995, partial [bacterium]